jgi:hypothetical protein
MVASESASALQPAIVEVTRKACPANEFSLRLGTRKAALTTTPCATLRYTTRKVNSFHRKHLSVSLRLIPESVGWPLISRYAMTESSAAVSDTHIYTQKSSL